jgi:hypothetical protein
MPIIHRRNLFWIALSLVLGACTAFTPAHQNNPQQHALETSKRRHKSTALRAFNDNNNNNRRGVFQYLFHRLAVFAGASTAAASQLQPALANDDETAGSIVEFVISNLDGQEGKTGKVKIQLQPEWAPKGVARFEVRTIV